MMYDSIFSTPVGKLGINTLDEALIALDFVHQNHSLKKTNTPFTKEVIAQIENYFADPTHEFTLPLQYQVTQFQEAVLKEMQRIPLGETRSYLEVSNRLHSSPRAVGQACKKNPIAIIIPCHRIVAKNHLGGFFGNRSGRALEIKAWLLAHEKRT